MPLITLVEVPSGEADFVKFWAKRYQEDQHELLYRKNINGPHTPDSLRELFRWKIGEWLFKSKLPLVEKHFISRLNELDRLPKDTTPGKFLQTFSGGGPIWRIFWLHCWNQRFPIYDQNVHRVMTFVQDGVGEELGAYSDAGKVEAYLKRYLPFFSRFDGIDFDGKDARSIDQALWAFGDFLKTWHSRKSQ